MRTAIEGQDLVSLKGVRKAFGSFEVLRGVDLNVAKGEVVAIIGPSGSGKSTILRTINGLTPVDHGAITVGDITVTDPKVDKVALQASRRHGVPAVQSVPAQDRVGERCHGADPGARRAAQASRGTGKGSSRRDASAGKGALLSRRTFRRPTAACGDRARLACSPK